MKKIIIAFVLMSFPLLCFAENATIATNTQENNREEIYIPENLDECFSELGKVIKKEDLEAFKNKKEDTAVSDAHFGIGVWIRNNWGLWANSPLVKYFNGLGIFHPDDMSSIILTSFHRFLNNKDIGLEKQIKYYRDYWDKEKVKEPTRPCIKE